MKQSKNKIAAKKRWENPEYRKLISENVRATVNSKKYLEDKINKLKNKLKDMNN